MKPLHEAQQLVSLFNSTFKVKSTALLEAPSPEQITLMHSLLKEEVQEFADALQPLIADKPYLQPKDVAQSKIDALDAITDIIYIALGCAYQLGIDDATSAAFEEVHKSNMSKLDKNGKPLFREDGKIIKSDLYKKPNLKIIMSKLIYNSISRK
jgi:predicted HAD superfamily Cof-like phosphohydrolase